ncbi:MAG: class I SAM-dependent methyltransferase [Deltaproteobacteria bacterium]|nr:MAG: class I SAM-dependent methyltransferase [Deltaproteobacteria bacterium]
MPGQREPGEWTDSFFGGLWLDFQRAIHPPEVTAAQARDIVELLGLEPGERVLDAPCGDGRLALALAAEGLDVTGIDRCAPLLQEARRAAAARSLAVRFEECDLRDADRLVDPVAGDDPFDVALNIWGSFGYFGDGGVHGGAAARPGGRGDLDFARAVASVLRPGGIFLIDCPGIETIMNGYTGRGWSEAGGVVALEQRAWDPVEGVMHAEWRLVADDGEGNARVELRHTHMRLYSAPELCRMLAAAGFQSFDLVSDLSGRPWHPGDRNIIVATR